MRAAAIVAASEACGVEATEVNKGEKQEDGETKFWLTMAMIFVFAIVGACEFLTKLKVFSLNIYSIFRTKFMGLDNDLAAMNDIASSNVKVSQNDMAVKNERVSANEVTPAENYALRSHGVSLQRAASSHETATYADAAIGDQVAFPPRRDASAGSSKTDVDMQELRQGWQGQKAARCGQAKP